MKVRFLVQHLPDGTINPDAAVVCEKVREHNWLHQETTPYEISLVTMEEMRATLPAYITDDSCDVPIGSIEFVETFLLRMYGVEGLIPILIPKELQRERYLGRRIAVVCDHTALREKAREWNREKVFLKSASQLKCDYTGVYNPANDHLPRDSAFFLSEPLTMLSEWRIFIWKGKVVGVRNYAGDQWLLPSREMVEEMVRNYTGAPDAYTLDVAVCQVGEDVPHRTVVVEVHRFISCGLYGFEETILPSMCIRGFRSLF